METGRSPLLRHPDGPLSDGERWTRAALDRLRARGFGPAAWLAFLAESLRRARLVRACRPALARQSRGWGLAGAVAAAPFGARHAGWWAGWWTMIDWHLGMLETAAGRPRPLRAADALTLARLWVAPLARREPRTPLLLAAAATDVLDGPLARRGGATRLGRDLDSAADTALLHMSLAGLVHRGRLPRRALTGERARLTIAAAVGLWGYFGASRRPATPEERAMAATLALLGLVLAAAGERPGSARRGLAEVLLAGAAGGRLTAGVRSLARPSR